MLIKNISILGGDPMSGEIIDVGAAILSHLVQGQWKTVKTIGTVAVKYIQMLIQVSTFKLFDLKYDFLFRLLENFEN